ncbi:MAG: RNA-binding S4 domain-containing protein [Clostridia bacterium]|jgi:ribosome-associated protein|nr:RNA-binding S4 domain-containing protein [Clostridia bacterium]
MEFITIETEYIKLGQFLKFANVVTDGIEAKLMIKNEEVYVNEEICTMRGKKLYDGDIVRVNGSDQEYKVVEA